MEVDGLHKCTPSQPVVDAHMTADTQDMVEGQVCQLCCKPAAAQPAQAATAADHTASQMAAQMAASHDMRCRSNPTYATPPLHLPGGRPGCVARRQAPAV